jgi:lipopolysaccharide assembly outer membrane protein LptD (OstA)
MRIILALCFLGVVTGPFALAQDTRVVTIVNADSTVGEVVDGERLRHLFGNVHLRHDDTDLQARRARQYLDRDLTIFEGDVRIFDATDTLRATSVSYNSRTRVGEARGEVRLSDAEAVLYSDSLIYFRAEKRAVFHAPVRLIEREGGGVLTSRRGTYFTERKEAFFEEDVRLEDSTSVLTSRLGRYGTEDKRADFTGDVHLTHERSTRVRADSLTHHRDTRISEARGEVVVMRFGEGKQNILEVIFLAASQKDGG